MNFPDGLNAGPLYILVWVSLFKISLYHLLPYKLITDKYSYLCVFSDRFDGGLKEGMMYPQLYFDVILDVLTNEIRQDT